MRVLLVDDHEAFRASTRAVMERGGLDVVGEVDRGAAVADAVRTLRPDVVLLDVQLPDVDGFEVARRLHDAGRAPLVVLTSARDADHYAERLARTTARGFIAKEDLTPQALVALAAP